MLVDRRAAAVRARNLIDDEEPESCAARARSGARERREGLPANGIGHRAAVLNLYAHFLRAAALDAQDDRHTEIAVLDGVPDKVRQNLRNTVGIPRAVKVAGGVAFERRLRVHEFGERTLRQRPKVGRTRTDRQRAEPGRPKSSSCVMSRVIRVDEYGSVGHLQRSGRPGLQAQRFASREDHVSGLRKSCPSTPMSSSAVSHELPMFLDLRGQLLTLPEQLDEDGHFALQQLRIDRLEQEIDGAGFVAVEDPCDSGGPAVTKMIGTRRVRSEPRISSASSKPSMPGMRTSMSASATSCWSSSSSAASPLDGPQHAHAGLLEQRLQNLQVLRPVVDDEHRGVVARSPDRPAVMAVWLTSVSPFARFESSP